MRLKIQTAFLTGKISSLWNDNSFEFTQGFKAFDLNSLKISFYVEKPASEACEWLFENFRHVIETGNVKYDILKHFENEHVFREHCLRDSSGHPSERAIYLKK